MTTNTTKSITKNVKAVNPDLVIKFTRRGNVAKKSINPTEARKRIAIQDMTRHLLNGDFIEVDTFDKVLQVSSAIYHIAKALDFTHEYNSTYCEMVTATNLYEAYKKFGRVVVNLAYVDDDLDLSFHFDFDPVINAYNAKQQAHFDTLAYHVTYKHDNIYLDYLPTAVCVFKHSNNKYYICRES